MPTLTARYVFPVSGPPLPNGLITYEGDTFTAVEPAGARRGADDLGNVAILPGFVNAHTHLDLSGARGLIPPTDPDHFTDWLKGVIAYRRTRTPKQVQEDVRNGLNEALQSGTTLLGDITSGGASYEGFTTPLAPSRAVLFWELIGLDAERLAHDWKIAGCTAGTYWFEEDYPPELVIKPNTPCCKWAISPHAPYSVRVDSMSLFLILSGLLATHIAESLAEKELLEKRTGHFVDFLKQLGVYREDAIATSWNEFLKPLREPQHRENWLLVHANYLPIEFPFHPLHTIVYCPRTHAAFGHPPHPFREFLARGVRVCLGTDSLASNPDLDILAEARFVRSRYPDFPGSQLLKMITLAGAEALGWADECGSLEPGKSADLVVVPLPDREEADPHDLFLKDDSPPAARRTLFRGQWR